MTIQELIVYFIFLPPVIVYGGAALIFIAVVLPLMLLWELIQRLRKALQCQSS